jgi:glycosyltransferase involved in cell wall biosynthesis
MASGAAVVTSQVSSLPEAVGDAALLVDPYNIASISAALDAFSEDDTFRSEYVRRGKEQAQKFRWSKTATIILELIKKSYP